MCKELVFCEICQKQTNYTSDHFSRYHLKKIHNILLKEYYDNYIKKENDGICEICGKPTEIYNFNEGYKRFHKSCFELTEEMIEKAKKTKLEKYGDQNYNNIIKSKKTKLEKYGNENYRNIEKQKETFKNKSINEINNITKKRKKYCLEKYGRENVGTFNSPEFLKSIKEKYGVDSNISQLLKINKIKEISNYCENQNLTLLNYINKLEIIKIHCNDCNEDTESNIQLINKRIKNNESLCLHCNPIWGGNSKAEVELLDYIKQNYDKEVINNYNFKNKGRSEIDIYLPELKLAFEFNGVYWHNELYKDKNYHKRKTEECEKQGIHLIHIYEDDWTYKQDIVKSRILNLLSKSNKIFARKCELKEVNFKDSKEFLKLNHIQGSCVSKINIGLYYHNELVSLMTFGGLRKNLGQISKEGSWELLRFCNKLNITVVGGAERLFKKFIELQKPIEVISYADRSWTMNNNNSLYDKLGFKLKFITKPNYYYINTNIRENRFKYRKSELVKEGFDINKTEHEIMLDREIYRIYDSGQLKYVFK